MVRNEIQEGVTKVGPSPREGPPAGPSIRPADGVDDLIERVSAVIRELVRFHIEPQDGITWLTADAAMRSLHNAILELEQLQQVPDRAASRIGRSNSRNPDE